MKRSKSLSLARVVVGLFVIVYLAGTSCVAVTATSDGGTATATHQNTVSTALPDQTTPQIQSITHTPLEVRVGEEVTIIVAVVPDNFIPTITYDTDNDGTFDDAATVTYICSGIKSVDVRVETAGGATEQTRYFYVLPPGAAYLTISGAVATSDTTPTWSWNVPTGATNFRFRLDRVATPNEEIVAWTETGGTGTTSYTSTVTRTVGESYLFTVESYDGAAWSCEASRTTLISSKGFYLCPSCSQKRTLLFAEHLTNEVLLDDPRRQYVFTMPKALRRFFRHARRPFAEVSRLIYTIITEFRTAAASKPLLSGSVPQAARLATCREGASR